MTIGSLRSGRPPAERHCTQPCRALGLPRRRRCLARLGFVRGKAGSEAVSLVMAFSLAPSPRFRDPPVPSPSGGCVGPAVDGLVELDEAFQGFAQAAL